MSKLAPCRYCPSEGKLDEECPGVDDCPCVDEPEPTPLERLAAAHPDPNDLAAALERLADEVAPKGPAPVVPQWAGMDDFGGSDFDDFPRR